MSLKNVLKSSPKALALVSKVYNILHPNNAWKYKFGTNKINKKGAFLKKCRFRIKGANNVVEIGKNARLTNCTFTIYGSNCNIKIGGGSTIVSNVSFWCEDDNSSIFIGQDFMMGSGHIASTEGEKIILDDDCMLSEDIEIRNGDSHAIINDRNERINFARPVVIGKHVWITAHSRIMKGSEIPDNCIIGNSSLVTHRFKETNAIYAGNPARLVKLNVNWDKYRNKYKNSINNE
jgi:Acetyltransferase (isoleucine patch superfamily)